MPMECPVLHFHVQQSWPAAVLCPLARRLSRCLEKIVHTLLILKKNNSFTAAKSFLDEEVKNTPCTQESQAAPVTAPKRVCVPRSTETCRRPGRHRSGRSQAPRQCPAGLGPVVCKVGAQV